MTLTELRYIVAVARERHFGRAAAGCFVSQPTLSIAVRKLEEELGVTLFERGSNEVSVTDTGERIIEQAQRVLDEVAVIKTLACELKNELVGPFRLGIIFTIGPYLLPALIPALRQLAPDMPLYLEENYTARLADMLKRSEVDAAIVAEPFDEPGIVTYPLYDEPFVVAVPKNHPWATRKSVSSAELANESVLLLTQGNCFRDQVLALCDRLQAGPTLPAANTTHALARTLQGSSLTTIRHMVASGVGITVMPATSVGPGDDALLGIVPFSTPAPTRRVVLACRKQFYRRSAIEALRQAIRNSALPGGVIPVAEPTMPAQ